MIEDPNSDLSTFSPQNRESKRELIKIPELPVSSRILVTGAGVFGGWTALHLLRLGYKVTLADCRGPGNSISSSGGESRLFRAIYGVKKYFDMTLKSRKGWKLLEKHSGQQIFYETGVMWLFKSGTKTIREEIISIMNDKRWPYEIISPENMIESFPMIASRDLDCLLIEKNAGYLMARFACKLVKDQFVHEGGDYHMAWVAPGRIENGKLTGVQINNKRSGFDTYVFACGPWLPELFPDVFGNKLSVTRQEIHYFGIPRNKTAIFSNMLPWVEWDPDFFYYGIPDLESRGFKIACDIRGEICKPDHMDRVPDPESVKQSGEFLSKRFPELSGTPLVESRVCQYTNTPDGNFILDLHPGAENVWLIGGGSGHGFKHGPAMGDLAAGMISGKRLRDPDFLLPD